MIQGDKDHTLAPEELNDLRYWLFLLYNIGVEMSSKPDPWARYFDAVIHIADQIPRFKNESVKLMSNKLFDDLDKVNDSGKMAIIYEYYDFCNRVHIGAPPDNAYAIWGRPWPWKDHWCTFLHGFAFEYCYDRDADQYHQVCYDGAVVIPNDVPLKAKMESVFTSWGDNPPAADINVGTIIDKGEIPTTAAKALLDAWWGNNNTSTVVLTELIAAQRLKLSDLMKSSTPLPTGIYFYILHLLIGFCTLTTQDQTKAQTIVSTITSSDGYPNDIFINQLLYLSLMYMADPRGTYKWNRDQIMSMLNDTIGCIRNTCDASKAIIAAIRTQLDIMNADASYPMSDPYNPSAGFNTRVADTLAALDDARKSMSL